MAGMRDQRSVDAREFQYHLYYSFVQQAIISVGNNKEQHFLKKIIVIFSLARTVSPGSGSKDKRSRAVDCLHCSCWASRGAVEAAVAAAAAAVAAPGEIKDQQSGRGGA